MQIKLNSIIMKATDFQLASRKKRSYMINFLIKQGIDPNTIVFSKDCNTYINKFGKVVQFDFKCRNVQSSKFTCSLMEKISFDKLMYDCKVNNYIPYVFLFFTDGNVVVQKLKNSFKIKDLPAPKSTLGDRSYKIKEFVEIPILAINTFKYDI